MLNSLLSRLIKIFCLVLVASFFNACKDEVVLNFSETNIIEEGNAIIEINIPKAEGKTEASKQINNTLSTFVSSAFNIDGKQIASKNIQESIENFKKNYKEFKIQIGKTLFTDLPLWEVLVDGEVIYKSKNLASIAMNSSMNTGGAHSNLVFKFYNFDIKTGQELETKDLINNIPEFTKLVKKYYNKELLSLEDESISAFKNDTFKLPKNLGFSEDGVIIFYDTFITGSNNIIEFTIPYTLANDYLNF